MFSMLAELNGLSFTMFIECLANKTACGDFSLSITIQPAVFYANDFLIL